jgi:serine/threonine-protein kinase
LPSPSVGGQASVLEFSDVKGAPERFGRFELVAPLGAGGMGEVFLARVRGAARVQKTVVVKRLRPDQLGDETARARFVDEARVAVSLSHPHVVPVFEFGELDGSYFLVMEWVRGGELSRVAGVDRAPLGAAAVALLGSQLCDALAYVHARADRRGARLIHGDVTPKNVLLSLDGHALLADFGLARFAPRGRAGTRRYLAPEQARGESSDGRADLYALALVLSEAATGQPAYDRDPDQAEKQARVGVVPRLDGCAADLAAVLRRALAPSREARFADAAAMRDAFESVLDERSGARSTGRAELVARVAAARDAGPAAPESRFSTVATRAATPLGPARAALLAVALLLVAGVVAVSARAAWTRPPREASRPSVATRSDDHSAAPRPVEAAPAAPSVETPPRPVEPTARPVEPTARPVETAARPVETAAARLVEPGVGAHDDRVVVPAPPTKPLRAATSAHSPASPPRSATRAPERAAPGIVALNAVPWAHVRIDGTDRGETPLLDVPLAPGPHLIELTNEPLGVRRELRITVGAGERIQRVEDLTR